MFYIVGLGNPGEEYKVTRHNIGRMAVEAIALACDLDIPGDFKNDKVIEAQKAKVNIEGESTLLVMPDTFMNRSGKSVAPLILGSAGGPIDLKKSSKNAKASGKGSNGKTGGKATKNPAQIALEKKAAKLIVIHDDIDLPFGKIKIVHNRGAGGHRGVESIRKAIKTEAFTRIKIGVVPTTPAGKLKKPKAGEKVIDLILGQFQTSELSEMKKVLKIIPDIVAKIVADGPTAAMNEYN